MVKRERYLFFRRVKPAVFDLFLAVGIASYLGLFYLALVVSLKLRLSVSQVCTLTFAKATETEFDQTIFITRAYVYAIVTLICVETILGFYMTSRPPCWCPQTKKRRPCWCPDPILRELNSVIMQTFSFVFVEKYGC